ncbi:hypothetical protein OFO01_06080 [Campylobacter sp. JMF_01 NE2]|uniref:hypothetical protein n=1 Tax=unclassified Campylobacter TaxID=2593542 RepID=UPI0022E9B241|nr:MULTISPECIES: hypothetical protein [unclassified Campylobacter]MDA3053021.1 hypothetical protein [Campylobacter sp. JMF_03 NE3]MDA3067352.1 hypothetical protein [Campylobacter sp. JMF_01 NE2]
MAWSLLKFLRGSGGVCEPKNDKTRNSDDEPQLETTDNHNKPKVEKKKNELSHNEKIYASIKEYKKGVLNSIKNDFGVEVRYYNDKGDIYALGLVNKSNVALVAVFSNNAVKKYEMLFHGIDTSYIKQENEKIRKEIEEIRRLYN